MFRFLKRIFDPKQLGESVISGVDKAFFTKEEKAEAHQKYLELYEPYKLTQRVLAFLVVGCFILCHFTTFCIELVYRIKEIDVVLIQELYSVNNETLGTLSLFVVGFYFGGGSIEGIVSKFKKK